MKTYNAVPTSALWRLNKGVFSEMTLFCSVAAQRKKRDNVVMKEEAS